MTIGTLVEKEKTIIEPETGERPVIKVEPPQAVYETKKTIIRGKQILWYIWLVIEMILLIRFLLKLFGANPANFFSILIDIISAPFIIIFNTLFTPIIAPIGSIVIEWSTLFAMFVYVIVALLVSRLFRLGKPIDPKEAEEKV